MKRGEWLRKLEFGIEEIILLSIIILNIFDALEIIGSDWDYIKKIISWSALGLLMFKASPSKLFVGFRKKTSDVILVFAYFFMIIKNLITYAIIARGSSSSFLNPFYTFLIENAITIELIGLYLGLFLIAVVCVDLSLRTPLKAPSLLHLMRADTRKYDIKAFFLHFFSLMFISLGFFLIFFNLIMEWLAIAIDAPLLMIGLVFYFFIVLKHKEKFSPTSFLKRFGDFGSNLYQGVIEHLRYKRAFLRVISGVLILHILTDMLTFIWYYVFGIGDPLYLAILGDGTRFHFLQLIAADSIVDPLSGLIHLSNLIAIITMMVIPILLWFSLYFHHKYKVSNKALVFLFCALIIAMINPTFRLLPLKEVQIYGVDIIGVSATTYQLLPFWFVIGIGILTTLIVSNVYVKSLKMILVAASKTFFILYSVLFFFSVSNYYLETIVHLFTFLPFLGIVFSIFFLITVLFYVVGILNFLVDTQEHVKDTI